MIELRLVMQVEHQHLHGDYSGTDRRYVLQYRVDLGSVWRTCQVVNFKNLSANEQCEIRATLSESSSEQIG